MGFDPYASAIGSRTIVTITGTTFSQNQAVGGAGGSGANGGDGTGRRLSAGTASSSVPRILPPSRSMAVRSRNNPRRWRAAAAGTGNGGNAFGGGIANLSKGGITLHRTLTDNKATGGRGGTEATAVTAQGGGLYNLGTTTLINSTITGNKAKGGVAGVGGVAGLGIGGGVYNAEPSRSTPWI